jgi:hypothetical protein
LKEIEIIASHNYSIKWPNSLKRAAFLAPEMRPITEEDFYFTLLD